jgi:hypothetical protein
MFSPLGARADDGCGNLTVPDALLCRSIKDYAVIEILAMAPSPRLSVLLARVAHN